MRRLHQSIVQPSSHSINQSLDQSIAPLLVKSINQSINQTTDQSNNKWLTQSINEAKPWGKEPTFFCRRTMDVHFFSNSPLYLWSVTTSAYKKKTSIQTIWQSMEQGICETDQGSLLLKCLQGSLEARRVQIIRNRCMTAIKIDQNDSLITWHKTPKDLQFFTLFWSQHDFHALSHWWQNMKGTHAKVACLQLAQYAVDQRDEPPL